MADTQVETPPSSSSVIGLLGGPSSSSVVVAASSSSSSPTAQQISNQFITQILTTASSSSAASSSTSAIINVVSPSSASSSTPPPPLPPSSSSSAVQIISSSSSMSGSNNNSSNNNNNSHTTIGTEMIMDSGKLSGKMSNDDGSDEPEAKRRKKEPRLSATIQEKLELRLGGILCCAVCLDLPKTAMYQCQMGHLMCAACFTHLLADGRLRDQAATCPNCRVEISKSTASRNLAVEKAVSELPSECQYCNKEFPSKSLERHEVHECEERPTSCKYSCIGCCWNGPMHEALEHEQICAHPKKSGAEVMAALQAQHAEFQEEKKFYATLVDLLSYEKIIFNDLQMKPYRTDEYVQKLFYETARFSAFNHQWAVKARINNSQRDPHQTNDRQLTYQLILKSKTTTPLSIHFFALKGPFSDMKLNTKIYKHDFTDTENASDYLTFPLPDAVECNRLLASKAINFRLIMFLLSK